MTEVTGIQRNEGHNLVVITGAADEGEDDGVGGACQGEVNDYSNATQGTAEGVSLANTCFPAT